MPWCWVFFLKIKESMNSFEGFVVKNIFVLNHKGHQESTKHTRLYLKNFEPFVPPL